MINSVTVKNYTGDELVLELMRPEKSGLIVESIQGLGPVNADINVSSSPTRDGGLYNSARIDTRNIVLNLLFADSDSVEKIRLLTYKYFPVKREVKLTFSTESRTAYINGYVESNEPDIFSKNEGCQISIVCPDPYFYSNELNVTSVRGVDQTFEFPFSCEYKRSTTKDRSKLGFGSLDMALNEVILDGPKIEFGKVKDTNSGVVIYAGDENTGVIIEFHFVGDVSGLAVYNTTTKQVIRFDSDKIIDIVGSDIKQSDEIIINTNKNQKSIILIREGLEYNILNAVNRDLDWIQMFVGYNLFAFTAETGEEYIRCYVHNRLIYEGI